MRLTAAGLLRMAAFGAVGGSLFDGFHTHSSTTAYPHPVFLLMAWWTPFLFAFAYVLLGMGYMLARPVGPRRPGLAELIAFAALYFASGYLPASNVVKLLVLLAGGLLLWAVTDRTWQTVVFGLVAAIVGPAAEIIQIHLGTFAHLQPDIAGIPMWLPALYFSSAPGAGPFMAWLGFGMSPEPIRTEVVGSR